jgi:hypothetical protein
MLPIATAANEATQCMRVIHIGNALPAGHAPLGVAHALPYGGAMTLDCRDPGATTPEAGWSRLQASFVQRAGNSVGSRFEHGLSDVLR